jgi:F420-dependent oxidoreductase-like protein
MKFSAWPSVTNPWSDLLEECRHIEAAGWHGIWIGDHFMANAADNSGPWQESWSIISALAAVVPRLRLGTLVTGNTYRHPAVLAKQVAQADIISGGRVVLGMGAGWQENEHAAYGIPFYTVGERLRRLEESVQVIRALFSNPRTTFEGRYYQLKDAPLAPKPVQAHLPILIGGGGEKVTLRIVARHADEWNVPGTPEMIAQKSRVLDEHCQREGRDPGTIKHVGAVQLSPGTPGAGLGREGPFVTFGRITDLTGLVADYVQAGVDELIVHFNPRRPLAERKELWSRFQEEIAPAFA